jgi:preprotein translocase subunit SecG
MIIHVLIAVVLVLLILIQSSKGGGLDGMMGVATNVLGGQAAPGFLKKATIISALLFMFSCFFLAFHLSAARKVSSTAVEKIRKERTEKQTTELPVTLPESGNVLDTEPVPLKSE